MRAKHWLLAGVGCLAIGIIEEVAVGLYWTDKFRTAGPGTASELRESFGLLLILSALARLLFLCGIVVLIVGFIKLAKEPSPTTPKSSVGPEPNRSE